jgi:4-diphosphocytidyl-2-C-methyl-D-erythritol kinase
LAAQLGSDVPFFLYAAQAIGRGRGHDLSPLSASPPYSVLLLNPRFSLSTAEVYRRYNLQLTKPENRITMLTHFLQIGDIRALGSHLFNDLEEVVSEEYPVIREMKEMLLAYGAAGAVMSGSGPTVFGLFADVHIAQDALARLRKRHAHWWSYLTTTISSLDTVWQRVTRDG